MRRPEAPNARSRGEATTTVRRLSLPAIVACLVLAAGCGQSQEGPSGRPAAPAPPAQRSAEVDIAKFAFAPRTVRVKAGGTVSFTNEDKAPHTAETEPETPGRFDTGTLRQSRRKRVRLDEPGRYSYFCAFHRFMESEVEVVE